MATKKKPLILYVKDFDRCTDSTRAYAVMRLLGVKPDRIIFFDTEPPQDRSFLDAAERNVGQAITKAPVLIAMTPKGDAVSDVCVEPGNVLATVDFLVENGYIRPSKALELTNLQFVDQKR